MRRLHHGQIMRFVRLRNGAVYRYPIKRVKKEQPVTTQDPEKTLPYKIGYFLGASAFYLAFIGLASIGVVGTIVLLKEMIGLL